VIGKKFPLSKMADREVWDLNSIFLKTVFSFLNFSKWKSLLC
jgi:hypothetical protein